MVCLHLSHLQTRKLIVSCQRLQVSLLVVPRERYVVLHFRGLILIANGAF